MSKMPIKINGPTNMNPHKTGGQKRAMHIMAMTTIVEIRIKRSRTFIGRHVRITTKIRNRILLLKSNIHG
tara:strand:- start:1024 stop:1233 length:210 start_codon:yes stop_codon:yes gene_type:complete